MFDDPNEVGLVGVQFAPVQQGTTQGGETQTADDQTTAAGNQTMTTDS